MQKVVGSNPISRFFGNALHVGGLVPAQVAEFKWNHPRISPLFQALMRISAWNRPDTRRSTGDFVLHGSRSCSIGGTARYPSPMAQERITVDPNRMRGLPSIRDTRVTVSAVLGQLAAGASIDELLADYPYLEREDVLAALEYAAAAAQERELAVVAPAA
jgi:uncharacterized protein (DUF433 family)